MAERDKEDRTALRVDTGVDEKGVVLVVTAKPETRKRKSGEIQCPPLCVPLTLPTVTRPTHSLPLDNRNLLAKARLAANLIARNAPSGFLAGLRAYPSSF